MKGEREITAGSVQCTPHKREAVEKCRFCAHSTHFYVNGEWVPSPARAYCTCTRACEPVDLKRAGKVRCDDAAGEGFRSIMSIIS
ncbi:MAG: hypothetical protein RQ758_08030 [Methanomicrobiaceae archaeon]|nr:hypothetical protein [Methanomicrobiaceae archaeon]